MTILPTTFGSGVTPFETYIGQNLLSLSIVARGEKEGAVRRCESIITSGRF